jgi:hypothetical protein
MDTNKLRNIIREEIKLIIEERGLTKKFDKTISSYQQISKQIQDEIKRFKTEFPAAKDKEAYKKKYIERMKPIQAKFKTAEQSYLSAIRDLPDPDEDELM